MNRGLRSDDIGPDLPRPRGVTGFSDDGGRGFVAGCLDREEIHRAVVDGTASSAFFKDSMYGAVKMPRSVMIPAMYLCGVTSNAGLRIFAPMGVSRDVPRCVTSR